MTNTRKSVRDNCVICGSSCEITGGWWSMCDDCKHEANKRRSMGVHAEEAIRAYKKAWTTKQLEKALEEA